MISFLNKIIALLLLLLLLPLFLIISFIILIDDRFPIIFTQNRIGRKNQIFKIYKFRTMNKNTKDIASHLVNEKSISFTKSGPFLRKFSLDELPQLINIIKGNMRFVGPRPALHNQNDLIKLRSKAGIDNLYPGITGWAQINGRDSISMKEKVDLEKYYFKNKGLKLNLIIIFKTFIHIFQSKNISH